MALPFFQDLENWQTWLSQNKIQGTTSFKEALALQEFNTLEGRIHLSLLPRLKSALTRPAKDASVYFLWSLDRKAHPLPQLTLTVKSEGTPWQITCQRCLSPMPWTLESCSSFWIASNEAQLEEAGIDLEDEAFFYDEPLTPLLHIEDEALLALPYSPRHPENQCKIAATQRELTKEKPHPFAALARLKGKL